MGALFDLAAPLGIEHFFRSSNKIPSARSLRHHTAMNERTSELSGFRRGRRKFGVE